MPGLLGDVLPWAYSQGDTAKRYLSGLLSDPMGTAQQAAGNFSDNANQLRGLLGQAFQNPTSFQPTNQTALASLVQGLQNGPMGFAPVGTVFLGKDVLYDNVYHGGPKQFSRFDPEHPTSNQATDAFWLTTSKDQASQYAFASKGKTTRPGHVGEANVYIKNPLTVDAMDTATKTAEAAGIPKPETWSDAANVLQYGAWIDDLLNEARLGGHDSLIVRNSGDAPNARDLADHIALLRPNRARFKK